MVHKQIKLLQKKFQNEFHEENAAQMKRYMKGKFPFYGIKAPERRQLSKQFINELKFNETIEFIIKSLWEMPEREYQYVALDYLIKNKKCLTEEHIDLIEYLITTRSWWDTVDLIASNLVGIIFSKYPALVKSVGNKWLQSENIWLKRSMIIFQLKYKDKTDEKLLFSIIKQTMSIDEFFIQKAIGWSLREYSKANPNAILNFIESADLSNLARREGLKHIKKSRYK